MWITKLFRKPTEKTPKEEPYILFDPFLRERWLNALRSGEYKRNPVDFKLVSDHTQEVTYCPIGLACELIDSEGWVENGTWSTPTDEGKLFSHKLCCDFNSTAPIAHMMGLTGDALLTIATYNLRHDFYETADFIEREFIRNEP